MSRQILFLALLLGSSLYAVTRGGPIERIGASTLLLGALLSVYLAHAQNVRFRSIETGILLVDTIIMTIFWWLAICSARYWPILIASLVSAEVTMHVMLNAVPGTVPIAYMDAIAMWSWPAQVAIAVATWRYRWRLIRFGSVRSWKHQGPKRTSV